MTRSLPAVFWVVSAILLLVRLLFIGTTMVIDDEAYYAMYARHLDFGYIDHGPVIGGVIRLFTGILGENAFGVRAFGVVFITVMGLAAYFFGKKCFSPTTGFALGLIVTANMLTHTNAVVVTPDAPMAFFTILAIMAYYLAFFVHRGYFYPAGVLLGLGVLSKITAVLPALGIFLFPIMFRDKRAFLKEPRYYASFLIALLVFLPFVIWNFQNDFAFVRYQGAHATHRGSAASFFELWGALFALAGPVAFVYAVIVPVRDLVAHRRHMASWRPFFALVAAVPLLFFVAQSALYRLEVNWPAPVFYSGIFIFGIAVGEAWPARRRWFGFQIMYSLILIAAITVQVYAPFIPLKAKNDITARYYSHSALDGELGKFLREHPADAERRIVANNYQIPSLVNLYQDPALEAICLSIGYHTTLYAFHYPDRELVGKDFLFIAESHSFPSHLKSYFDDITLRAQLESTRGGEVVNTFTVWRVDNYRGKAVK